MTALSKHTKAQLIEHIVAQERQLKDLAAEVNALRVQLHAAKPASAQYQASAEDHKAYWNYVAEARRMQREAGHKVTSYKTFPQWFAQRQQHAEPCAMERHSA